jgi:hypothetical protein
MYQSHPAEAITISHPQSFKARADFAKLASNSMESTNSSRSASLVRMRAKISASA